ncbi:SH3 domain-binding glutamic acid-rich-like protein 3 [Lates japonicus]|uniref:SH3 domain-binding glutamic acid-rich-like protein 3 n=1 Tax=Lates japonicus TaxID=270547 RepID=A0AAD3MUJ5_LATJO|nr:SH3 domain-binding glutamic acid-rich-like protein 3 [Lates japonicus]
MPVTVFYSSVCGSLEMRKRQDRIIFVLSSKNIPYKLVDISQNSDDKDLMRQRAGDPTALPPQICNGDVYCGDFIAFENAIEMEELDAFLKL